jgi:hypothetical protein
LQVKILIFDKEESLEEEINSSFNFTILSDPKLYEIHKKFINDQNDPTEEQVLSLLTSSCSKIMNAKEKIFIILFILKLLIF